MKKLRIKTGDGKLERISVADGNTLGDLKVAVAEKLFVDPSSVKLSLNKKVLCLAYRI